MAKFELASRFAGCDELLPKRSTANSAGYDLIVAEDTLIGTHLRLDYMAVKQQLEGDINPPLFLNEVVEITKQDKNFYRPVLVSTGIKCKLAPDEYLEIVPRSSTPLKYWLLVANSPGIIDADYYNNPDNEGEIFIQVANFFPFDIELKKGDKIAQAIIRKYYVTEDDAAGGMRAGGFGSTG